MTFNDDLHVRIVFQNRRHIIQGGEKLFLDGPFARIKVSDGKYPASLSVHFGAPWSAWTLVRIIRNTIAITVHRFRRGNHRFGLGCLFGFGWGEGAGEGEAEAAAEGRTTGLGLGGAFAKKTFSTKPAMPSRRLDLSEFTTNPHRSNL